MPSGPNAGDAEKWLEDVGQQLSALSAQLDPLLLEQSRLVERQRVLEQLVASFRDVPGPSEPATAPLPETSGPRETVRERVHRQALDVLRAERGSPMHINDLTEAFRARGYAVPGQGKPANISVHLSGWDDVTSPERGIYQLTEQANGAE